MMLEGYQTPKTAKNKHYGGYKNMLNTGIMIKLYTLDELSENARQKAIEEHRQFALSIM